MDISLHTTGSEIVIENFRRLEKKAGNMRSAFGKIADLMTKSHEVNFKSQGSRFGKKWGARKRSYPWPILQKTGKLSKSFKSSYDSHSAMVENTASYAKWHQGGTRKMAARPTVGWAEKALNDAVRVLRKSMMED